MLVFYMGRSIMPVVYQGQGVGWGLVALVQTMWAVTDCRESKKDVLKFFIVTPHWEF